MAASVSDQFLDFPSQHWLKVYTDITSRSIQGQSIIAATTNILLCRNELKTMPRLTSNCAYTHNEYVIKLGEVSIPRNPTGMVQHQKRYIYSMPRWHFTGRLPQPRRSLARISWNCGQPLPETISSLCYHLLRTRSDPPKVGVRKDEVHILTMHVELRCGSCKKGKLEVQLSSASTSGSQDFLIHRLFPTCRHQSVSARQGGIKAQERVVASLFVRAQDFWIACDEIHIGGT